MRVTAEFTTEPFVGEQDEAPRPAAAALEAAASAGLEVDFGPFGSSMAGSRSEVLGALPAVLDAAFAAGATRVTVQVTGAEHVEPG